MPRQLDPYVLRDDVVAHLGHVFLTSELREYAAWSNISFRTLAQALRTTAHRLDLARPSSLVWHFEPWTHEVSAEHTFARAASLASGTWPVISGAWALHLLEHVDEGTPALAYGLRFVAVERVTCAPGRSSRSAQERDAAVRMMGGLPPSLCGRRVVAIGTRAAAHVTITSREIGAVVAIDLPGAGCVHVHEPHRAAVEMFASVRLSGGFNAARDTLDACIDRLDPELLGMAARSAKLATRRRLAEAVYEIGLERRGREGSASTARVPWRWPFHRPDMERWLELRWSRGATLLDPHREEVGPTSKRHATRDNRAAPLRPAAVLTERVAAELEPEVWHALEHPDPTSVGLDVDVLRRYGYARH